MSTIARIHRGANRRLSILLLAAISVAAAFTATARPTAAIGPAYGWPIEPFHAQHPVRGFFGDPRIDVKPWGIQRQFHFGIDVSAPNGTPVYATLTGTARIHDLHHDVVLIDGPGGVEFSYWHIVPTVRSGQYAVAYRTMIGRVESPWGHVHFSDARNGVYVNPLRPGAMGPYIDETKPTVAAVELERSKAPVRLSAAHGTLDLVAEVFDTTPLAVPRPWANMPVVPALVRWRMLGRSGPVTPWRTALDFRETIPDVSAYDTIFAQWTRQNHPNQPGRYRVYLAHGWSSTSVPDGRYRIEVEATDTRGNTGRLSAEIRVSN